ncbi:hypothetical protein NDU88_004663 [Pleurodeles waltl]|uniref:Uncharacterized protein n=1 Tax=Pleurodeles waltl TaxID=8319 RepID=A0AAV7SJF4_PLEWA|nr:hypothetical protein NDU88_004663 [Pleurodeles waltl]
MRRTAPSKGAAPPGRLRCSSAILALRGLRSRPAAGTLQLRHGQVGRGTHVAPCLAGEAPTATQGGRGTLRRRSAGLRWGPGAQAGDAREPRGPRARRLNPAAVGSGRTTVSASSTNSPGNGLQACCFFFGYGRSVEKPSRAAAIISGRGREQDIWRLAGRSRPHRGLRHLKWRLPILRVSNYAFFRADSRAVSSACIKSQKSQVWDKGSGRSAGARLVPAGGKRSSLTGALRRSVQWSRAVCGRTRPALCTPGSPPGLADSSGAHSGVAASSPYLSGGDGVRVTAPVR